MTEAPFLRHGKTRLSCQLPLCDGELGRCLFLQVFLVRPVA